MNISKRETDAIVRYVLAEMHRCWPVLTPLVEVHMRRWIRAAIAKLNKPGKRK